MKSNGSAWSIRNLSRKCSSGVDILTLSATPIPRTLYMSLSGVRDISILQTAPENRRPIKTICTEYSDEILREALVRETGAQGSGFLFK